MEEFRVAVVGAGYVGLATAACLAHVGHRVTCVDKDADRIEELQVGQMPIYEPHLAELVARGAEHSQGPKRLTFAGSEALAEAVIQADAVFIAVDTPKDEHGSANLSNIGAVAHSIGYALAHTQRENPLMVVNKSTVPVGSGDYLSMLIDEGAAEVPGGDDAPDGSIGYRVVSNPEFMREGNAVYDSLFPNRIVLGSNQRDALDTLRELYKPIVEQTFATEIEPRPATAAPLVTTDLASAEMIKYAANAFLATKISFANEIASICELVGADITSVSAGIGLDERIGPRFLNAGIGWGGSCFPKDIKALQSTAREYDYEPAMLDAAVAINENQHKQVLTKLQRELRTLKGKRVALLGLAFKPDTDDLREAPSLAIARDLDYYGARVVGYDPVAGKVAVAHASTHLPNLKIFFDPYEALEGAHAAVVVTEWEEIRMLDFEKTVLLMKHPRLLVDGRNALDPAQVRDSGLLYRGFGRG